MAEYYMILTAAGHAAYAQAGAGGGSVQISAVAIGDGGGAAVQPAESWTALVREVWRSAPALVEVVADNSRLVLVEAHVPHNVGGWFVREVGLLSPEGVLLAVGNHPESYKPALESGAGKELMLRLYIEHSNASQTTLKINPDIVMASCSYVLNAVNTHDASPTAHAGQLAGMSDHVADKANPHQVTAVQAGAEPAGAVAAHDESGTAHADLRAAIAGIVIPNATEAEAGIIRLATQAQVLAGAGGGAVTPETLAARIAALVAAIPAPAAIAGAARGLVMSTTGTTATVTVTAAELIAKSAAGLLVTLSGLALSANLVAANIDTGLAPAAASWYYAWVFAKADKTAVLRFSLSSTAPTIPAGYTYMARVGAIPTDATSLPLGLTMKGNKTRLALARTLASGNYATYTAVSVAAFAPPTATCIDVSLSVSGERWGQVNSNPDTTAVGEIEINGGDSSGAITSKMVMITGGNIYYASYGAGLYCIGWEE